MKTRRIALIAVAITLTVALAGFVILHLPSVQRTVTSRLLTIITDTTCLRVEAEILDYRLWPGAVSAHGIVISDPSGRTVSIGAVEASWLWSEMLASTPRLRRLVIDDLQADPFLLPVPCSNSSTEEATDLWSAFAVDELKVNRAVISGAAADVEFSAKGIQVRASLMDQHLGLRAAADSVHVHRDGRSLNFGPIEADLDGNADAIVLKNLEIKEGPVRLRGSGSIEEQGGSAAGEFTGVLDLEEVLLWWQPEWANRADSRDPLEFGGEVSWSVESGLQGGVRLAETPVRLAGFEFDTLEADFRDLELTVAASHSSWGRVSLTMSPDQALALQAHLLEANPMPALALAGIDVPPNLPKGIRISGNLSARTTFPPTIDTITGSADLRTDWQGGQASIQATAGNGLEIDHLTGHYFGAHLDASATISSDGMIDGNCSLTVAQPGATITQLSPLFSEIVFPSVGGGPLHSEIGISGTIAEPAIDATIGWTAPEIEGSALDYATLLIVGDLNHIDWKASLEAQGGRAEAAGTASPTEASVAGDWQVEAPNLAALLATTAALSEVQVAGSIMGNGTLRLESSLWEVSASLHGENFKSDMVDIPSFTIDVRADTDCLSIESAEAEVLGGQIQGSGTICPPGPEGQFTASLQWSDLDPSNVVATLPDWTQGRVSGHLEMSGPVLDPVGDASFSWHSSGIDSPLESAGMLVHLREGVVTLASEQLQTTSGPLALRADMPLGDLPRPAGLWPSAPPGPWQLSLDGYDLALAPLFDFLNRPDLDPSGHSSLKLRASWPPDRGGLPQAHLELNDFEATIGGRTITTERPMRLALDDRGIIVTEINLRGHLTTVSAGGSINLMNKEIDMSVDGSLDPRLAALAPIQMSMAEPITFNGRIVGLIGSWTGHLELNHTGGSIEISDPPVEITDASLDLRWTDDHLEIESGSAHVNRGLITLGGAWDPESGQGIVAEIEDVTVLLPGGIITRWDGLMALEPAIDRLAILVGDLNLKRGVWDYPFNLGNAFRGGFDDEELDADDISHSIGLDLEIRGGSGITVDNNLGKFGVRWSVLEVAGTAAEPQIIGDLNFLPGGILNAAGHPIAIRRGLIQFTGDPLTDPLVEVIPEDQIYASSGDTGDLGAASQQQASSLAAAGLASGIGAVFGLENTSIKPEEIALETDEDTSTDFSIGQQLNHNTAIFLTTDLRNSQKRTTLLQLWRLPSFPGLTIQAQTRTDPGEADVKLLQRFSWGGTLATDDQPRLHKVRLEGEWPWSKRKLRKATGLVRDQPWDPFFLFLGDIRLKKKLAEKGWPEARVKGRIEGSAEYPIAVFTCSPGRFVEFSFEGDTIDKDLQPTLKRLYRFPPLEDATLAEIKRIINRHLWADGHPEASTTIESDGNGHVVVSIDAGPRRLLTGPVFSGVPAEATGNLKSLIAKPTELAQITRDPERGARIVRQALAARGYREVRSVDIWAVPTGPGAAEVHIEVDSGPLARAARFELVGTDPLGLTDAEDFLLQENMTLDRDEIDRAVASLRRTYRKQGFTDAKVRSQIYDDGDGQWAILLVLDPGSTAVIDRVEVAGRRHLSPSILLEGLSVKPGELFLLDDLDDSVSRLVTFEPIERVSASTRPEGGKVVVDLDIVEKPRWTTEFGGGWNSDRGLTARIGATDHNLLGRGISLGFRSRWEKDFVQGRLVLGIPPKPGGRFSAGLNASYTEDVLPAETEGDLVISENIREATLEGRYRIRQGLWTRGYYRFTRTRSFEKEPFDPDFPLDITIDVAVLGGQIVTDRLDNPFDPRHGYYLGFDLSWADEALGSDKENIRGLLTSSLATEPRHGWTWFQSLRVGAAKPFNGTLDRQSRFFAGGPASVRGFKLDSVGPVEVIGDTTLYAGGEALFVLNEELRFPVWQSLRGAAFIDTGQVWETWSDADFDLSVGAGVGLRWSTPIGPLWFDAAWPVANPGSNRGARYSFGIGRTF